MTISNAPRHITLPATRIAGICVRASNADTSSIEALWGRFFGERISESISNAVPQSPVYGVYSEYESDLHGAFTVTAGVSVPLHMEAVAPLMHVDIQPGEYLEFVGHGPMPDVVMATWKQVWNYFEQSPDKQRAYQTDFEKYGGKDEVSVYVSIK